MSSYFNLIGAWQGEAVSSLARTTAGALVGGVWQGMALCAAAGLILKLVPRSTATLRFIVWMAVFVVSVSMPFVNLSGTGFIGKASTAPTSHVPSHLILDLGWSYILAGFWIVAACFRLAQLAMQALGLRSLWLSAVPVASGNLSLLDVPLIVNGRMVQLCTTEEVDRPSVIGFFTPKILIPAWLFDQLTAVELNHIVLHELEHLRRRDDWLNLFQKVGLVLLPLNPALFWIDRRLSTERELACDDGVLERTNRPRAYAASLASIAERRLDVRRHRRLGALALAATGLRYRRSELGLRIESILGNRSPVNRLVGTVMAATFVVGVAAAGAGLAHAPQLVSFGPPAVAHTIKEQAFTIAPHQVVSPMAKSGQVPSASQFAAGKFQNVSLREPVSVRVKSKKASLHKPAPDQTEQRVRQISQEMSATPKQRLVVLTSWENDSPVSRVAVQTPDGRFFLTPYAAVPTQAGWLFVQL